MTIHVYGNVPHQMSELSGRLIKSFQLGVCRWSPDIVLGTRELHFCTIEQS